MTSQTPCPTCAPGAPATDEPTTDPLFCPTCQAFLPDRSVGYLASPGQRLGAFIVDLLLISVFVAGAALLAFYELEIPFWVYVGIFSVLATIAMAKSTSGGKLLLGLRVHRMDGSPAGFMLMSFREGLPRLLNALGLFIGYYRLIRDPRHQGWHDLICRTIVLSARPPKSEKELDDEADAEDKAAAAGEVAVAADDPQTAGEAVAAAFLDMGETFVAFLTASRALWGVNVSYVLEGFVYFGMLGYMAMYFNEYVGLSDSAAGVMVGVLTWGITFAMFLFGGLGDKFGFRRAMIAALVLMLIGRAFLAGGPYMGLAGSGMWSPIHLVALLGIWFVVLGYGMYQPAAYAAVRQVTTPRTAAMGYAMLYALMNLGGWLPSFFAPIRRSVGISGSYWVYTGITVFGLLVTTLILSRKIVERAIAEARARQPKDTAKEASTGEVVVTEEKNAPLGVIFWGSLVLGSLAASALILTLSASPVTVTQFWGLVSVVPEAHGIPVSTIGASVFILIAFAIFLVKRPDHPFRNARFTFFIFALIPVQTLFAHNWLTLPMYVERAFRGTAIGNNFEFAVNANPLLIFFLVPIVTALTRKRGVYSMMILGTFVMAVPTFLLVLGANVYTLFGYLFFMTIGEAMWQPRFLQYAAEIAPEGKTAMYMGVAQFPWFLTKVVTSFYSGWFLMRYCPDPSKGLPLQTEQMWLIYALIALSSSVILVLARGWMKRGTGHGL